MKNLFAIIIPLVLLTVFISMAFTRSVDEVSEAIEIREKAQQYYLTWKTSGKCADLKLSFFLFNGYEILAKRNGLKSKSESIDILGSLLDKNGCFGKTTTGGGITISKDKYKYKYTSSTGGGVSVGYEVPSTFLATFYMDDIGKQKFLETLDLETRIKYENWTQENALLNGELKTMIDQEIKPLQLQQNRLLFENALKNTGTITLDEPQIDLLFENIQLDDQ